ncbi:MAG: hypothetical protein GY852_09545 [bacterium]|nr:hypothetical protein [bacterium]
MNGLATANRKVGPHTRGGPMVEPKACLLARVAEDGHRPMRPLTRIARIHLAGVEGKLGAINNATLSDGRKLTDALKSTLNGDGGICGDIVGNTPANRDSLLKKTLDEIVLLLKDKETSLENVMDKEDARMIRRSLGKAAKSIHDEIEQRVELQLFLEWMRGENTNNVSYPPISEEPLFSRSLEKMGEGASQEGAVIGHGV